MDIYHKYYMRNNVFNNPKKICISIPKDFSDPIRTQSAELPANPCTKSIGVLILDLASCLSSRPCGIRCNCKT